MVSADLRDFAKELRGMQTGAEALFWEQVRAGRLNGHKFKRQVPIAPYIVDFLCSSARLIVELDGRPHEDPLQQAKDERRDRFLEQQGFHVLRFSNDEFLGNPQLVMEKVLQVIGVTCGPSRVSKESNDRVEPVFEASTTSPLPTLADARITLSRSGERGKEA
jgi:very-short-patch-repair endonuclease